MIPYLGSRLVAMNAAGLVPGALLYTYLAGGLTPATTHTDQTGASNNTNPVVCDAAGQADVYIDPAIAYRFILKTSAGVTIWDRTIPATLQDAGGVGFLTASTYAVNTVGAFLKSLIASAGSSIIGFIQAGTGAIARTIQAKLRERVDVRDFGASPSASGSANRAAIQAALDYIKSEGGTLYFEPRVVYAITGGGLDFRTSDSLRKEYPRNIEGQGATLDYSASGLTSGTGLAVGATVIGNAAEVVWSNIRDLVVIGPESATNIIPKYISHLSDATSATTFIGVYAENALNVNIENVYATRCYKGFRYMNCWRGSYRNIKAHKCVIGHHIDAGCTHMTSVNLAAEYCTFPVLIQPATVSTAITTITMIAPLLENCTTGFHLDPNAATGAEIQNISIINPYLENIYYDHFRVGIAFSATIANAATRGADRAGYISSLFVDNGRSIGEGASTSWGSTRKAFYFASTPKLGSGRISFPCTLADITNFPQRVAFQGLARAEDIATQQIVSTAPGEGFAHVVSAGTTSMAVGNIVSSSKISTGTYDVVFDEPYIDSDSFVVTANARISSFYCAVNDANTTAGKVRIEVRTDAGVLTDAKFMIRVAGILAAY